MGSKSLSNTFRYIADVDCYRNWGNSFKFSVGPVTFESGDREVKDGDASAYPFVAYLDIRASDIEAALQSGRAACMLAVDLAALMSGYAFEIGTDGIRPVSDDWKSPGIIDVAASLLFRNDVASDLERDAMLNQIDSWDAGRFENVGPLANHALRWYAEALREPEAMDKYIKVFVALDMLVPFEKNIGFEERAASVASEMFPSFSRSQIVACIDDISATRNALFHEGVPVRKFSIRLNILERLTRAVLRRHAGLPDEMDPEKIFADPCSVDRLEEIGGVYGWLPRSGPLDIRSKNAKIRVGDPDARDGKHYIYARDAGDMIRATVHSKTGFRNS